MRERYGFAEGLCPVAEAKSTRTLALPFHARLAPDDQAYVAATLRSALGRVRGRPVAAVACRACARGGLGEALAVWAVWAVTLVLVVVTYSRIDGGRALHVHGDGIRLGLSRAVVHTNWPVALVAIVLVLVAMRSLPARAWWLAARRSRSARRCRCSSVRRT